MTSSIIETHEQRSKLVVDCRTMNVNNIRSMTHEVVLSLRSVES
jgi:hypothetical protein